MNKKIDLQGDVFEGISSVFVAKGGLTFAADSETGAQTATPAVGDMLEFPVSEDSGFNFDTGAPSIDTFKIQGLNAAWVSSFTPGDGSITLEIPCNETNIMETCFGSAGVTSTVTLPANSYATAATSFTGKGFGAAQKAITLGLMVLNDSEDKMLYVKKAKFMAQAIFDGSNKPLCVVLTGNLANSADTNSFGVLDLVTA